MSTPEQNQLRGSPGAPTRPNQAIGQSPAMNVLLTEERNARNEARNPLDPRSPMTPSDGMASLSISSNQTIPRTPEGQLAPPTFDRAEDELRHMRRARSPPGLATPETPTPNDVPQRRPSIGESMEGDHRGSIASSQMTVDSSSNSNNDYNEETLLWITRFGNLQDDYNDLKDNTAKEITALKAYGAERTNTIDRLTEDNAIRDTEVHKKSQADYTEIMRLDNENRQLLADQRDLKAQIQELEEERKQRSEATQPVERPAMTNAQTQTANVEAPEGSQPQFSPRRLRKRTRPSSEDGDNGTSSKRAKKT